MLQTLLRLAARNIRRNTRRSIITGFVILVSTSAIIVGRGLLNGVSQAIIDQVTLTMTGDLQIHRDGYAQASEALPLGLSMTVEEGFMEEIRGMDGAVDIAGRIAFSGLVTDTSQENTTPFYGLGFDPVHEPKITPHNFERIIHGQPLRADAPDEVVVGQALAESLNLKVGDEITILVNTQAGSLNGRDVTIGGISSLQLPGLANKRIFFTLAAAQHLLRMEGEATELAVKVEESDPISVAAFQERLAPMTAGRKQPLEVSTWMDVSARYLEVFAMWESVFAVFVGVFYIMMVSGIVNTMLMSVLERVSEIGMMMAIGVKRRTILQLFFAEAALLAIIGSLAGVLTGGGLVLFYGERGLYLPLAGALPKIVYPTIEAPFLLWTCLGAVVVALLASLAPVYRASRLTPIEALSG